MWTCPNCEREQPETIKSRGDFRCECGYLEIWGKAERDRRRRPLNVRMAGDEQHAAQCFGCAAKAYRTDSKGAYCEQSGRSIEATRYVGCPLGFWGPRRILHFVSTQETARDTKRRIGWQVTESTDLAELQEAIADTAPAVVAAREGLIAPEMWRRLQRQNRWTRFIVLRRAGDITFGVTHYLRPEYLQKCLASIRRNYPGATIDTQDTQGNVSWGRNELVRRCQTPYFVLLEEDMELTEQTDIDRLRRIVEHDEELAGCGGWLIERGQELCWRHDFDSLRGRSTLRPSRQPARVTPAGDIYYPCEAIHNFGLFRTEALRQVQWDEELPLGEHMEYFWRLRHQWRVALSPDVTVLHAMARPSDEYLRARLRDGCYKVEALAKMGLKSSDVCAIRGRTWQRPNVVVMGVGHSNTTITTRQIAALGWELGDADEEYAESVSVRELCWRMHYDGESIDVIQLSNAINNLPQPWVLKQPTFATTLHRWLPALAQYEPVLVWIQKDLDRVEQSYISRGESPENVRRKWDLCQKEFARWPWGKISLRAEDIAAAVSLFDVARSTGQAVPHG